MFNKTKINLVINVAFLMMLGLPAYANTPKYSADIPKSLLTPDRVETKTLGKLKFFDGMPSKETVKKTYDFLDLSRAVEVFLNAMPMVSMYSMLEGLKQTGAKPGELVLFDNLMDARTLFLTPNSTTPYGLVEIDLKKGPWVVEIPSDILGGADDAAFRFVTNMGVTGPDKGKGGKYLFIGPDYKGKIPKGYFVAKSPTYRNWLFFRTFVKDNNLKAATIGLKKHYRAYPLAKRNNPPKQKMHFVSGKQFNTIHSNDANYYQELNAVVQYEPATAFDPELVGLFASIGIKKSKPFKPDSRMKKILEEASKIANAASRAIVFRPRNKAAYFFPDRQWYSPFAGGSYEFMNHGEKVLDDRIMFHYYATGITPSMVTPKVGTGSAYAMTAHDSKGNYLNGSHTYTVTLPSPIPANNFWSFMLYSGQTRSMLETDQRATGIDSKKKTLKANKDGSYTIWFSATAPKGHENNWAQTIPGKSYNVLLRLYGPLKPWFDKNWRPGDFKLIK